MTSMDKCKTKRPLRCAPMISIVNNYSRNSTKWIIKLKTVVVKRLVWIHIFLTENRSRNKKTNWFTMLKLRLQKVTTNRLNYLCVQHVLWYSPNVSSWVLMYKKVTLMPLWIIPKKFRGEMIGSTEESCSRLPRNSWEC